MKYFSILFLLAFSLSCTTTKEVTNASQKMDGTWKPVKQEFRGSELPKALIESQRLTIDGSHYTVTAESVDKGDVVVKGDKMDIYGKEGVNDGKHFTAIYKLENNQLTICYNLAGDSYPTSFETTAESLLFLSVFERE